MCSRYFLPVIVIFLWSLSFLLLLWAPVPTPPLWILLLKPWVQTNLSSLCHTWVSDFWWLLPSWMPPIFTHLFAKRIMTTSFPAHSLHHSPVPWFSEKAVFLRVGHNALLLTHTSGRWICPVGFIPSLWNVSAATRNMYVNSFEEIFQYQSWPNKNPS